MGTFSLTKKMPKQITDLKEFTTYFVNEEKPKKNNEKKNKPQNSFTNKMVIKHNNNGVVKFKLRTARRLLTYKTDDKKVVNRIMASLPPQLARNEIKSKVAKGKKGKNY